MALLGHRKLFCHGNKTMEKFHQPKQLFYSIQNMQRIKLVSGPLTKQDRPSPEGWGWSWDDEILSWTPSLLYRLWTTLTIASKACAELMKCDCKSKSGCGARCGCKKANWNSVVVSV